MGCEHCDNRKLPSKGVAHEFRILTDDTGAGIYYCDSELGWEGTEINYCPWCGEKLFPIEEQSDSEIPEPKTRAEILDAAKQCVCKDRNDQYGEPEESLGAIAEFWQTFLRRKKGVDREINAEDASAMMILFKIARTTTGKPKIDSWIDMAGYAACGGEIQEGEKG